MIGQHTYQIQGIDAGYHIFTHTDGSKLKTKPIDFVTRKGTLGWTKMGKILGLHSGVFQDVGHVVRLNTKDGIVNGPCVADTSVSYECEYWFYVS
jgi:hypothetical protein